MITSEAVNRAIDYILEHIEEDLSLERVAACCHFSKYYFSRLFKAQTGECPRVYQESPAGAERLPTKDGERPSHHRHRGGLRVQLFQLQHGFPPALQHDSGKFSQEKLRQVHGTPVFSS